MSVPSVLIRKSTKEILKYAEYPRLDISPFPEGDLDPDLEWCIINIPFPEPDYDPRIYILTTNIPDLNFLDSFEYHPNYAGIKEYKITYFPKKRTKEDIVISIENAEKQANNLIWSEAVHKDKMLLMLNASSKSATGAQLNTEEQSLIEDMNSIAVKISKNKNNKEILVGLVNSGEEPNIDSGWESVE